VKKGKGEKIVRNKKTRMRKASKARHIGWGNAIGWHI